MAKDKEKAVIIPEYMVDVIAREASTKDSEGKSIRGKILGEGKTYAYTSNKLGLEAAVKRHGYKIIVDLIDRQFKTDKRNTMAAEAKAPEKGLKTKCKVMVDMIKSNTSLKPIFIDEVKTWKHIDSAARAAVVVVLEAV